MRPSHSHETSALDFLEFSGYIHGVVANCHHPNRLVLHPLSDRKAPMRRS
jgi:hypothetical protein